MRARVFLRAKESTDEGFAMVFVIITMLVVTLFVSAGLAYAVNSQILSRHDQDYGAALAAAQAGVDDYVSHLNRNDNYARLTPFNDCSNTALRGPKAPANSCGWTATDAPGWQRVNNAAVSGTPEFHYDVNATGLDSTGSIDVISTGRVNKVSRSLQVSVNRGGSTQYLYYTDHEDGDPSNPVLYPTPMSNTCYSYWWGQAKEPQSSTVPRKTGGSGCREITFIGGDVLDGSVHLNDTPLFTAVGGKLPDFKKGLEVSDPACKLAVSNTPTTWVKCDRNGTGASYNGIGPKWKEPQYLPDTSGAFASYPGCSYTGPTRIIFNADGTMRVWSKQSSTTAACGGSAPFGVTVQVPVDKVIYVKSATSTHKCVSGEIDGTLPLGDWDGTDTDLTYSYDDGMQQPSQFCGQGNAYLQGTLSGRVTVATQNSVTVTGDLKLAGGLNGNDLLGLVAGNSVEVFHPILTRFTCSATSVRLVGSTRITYCSGSYTDGGNNDEVPGWPARIDPTAAKGVEIDASIQTLAHSFLVQNYDKGTFQGALSIRGSLAQKWRGIVGQGTPPTTGYLKDYKYDLRLTNASPPYFPQFVNSIWGARRTGEVSPQY